MKEFAAFMPIEQEIILAVRELLSGRVNELLGELEIAIPLIEFSDYEGCDVVVPLIELSECERSEKERIICVNAYSMTVTFFVPGTVEAEPYCFVYATAFHNAIDEDRTLGGIVDKAVIIRKKYMKPKTNYGEDWQVVVMLRVTNEQ